MRPFPVRQNGSAASVTAAGPADAAPGPPAASAKRTVLRVAEQYGLLMALLLAFVAFSIALPSTFPTVGNVKAMIDSQAIILLLAIAVTLPLRSGDFDLSIAGLMTATAALTAQLTTHGTSLGVAIIVVLAVGLATGLINGLLIVKLGVDSFVTTLGMMTALSGLAFAFTSNQVITNLPSDLLTLARQQILGFPTVVWIGWVLVAVAWYVYQRTPFGRYLLFIGGSRESARLAGLRVDILRISCFATCSLIAAFTGVLLAGNVGQVDPSIASQFLLQPFAGVFLGATTITVGRVNSLGTLVALYLLVVGITGLQLYGAQPWVSDVFNGAALVLAVTFARLAARSNAGR
ncbi:MAG TPA: ABC transporter permease [Streptosporangiaceae bacterium]|jgi:ribose transport system permease protein